MARTHTNTSYKLWSSGSSSYRPKTIIVKMKATPTRRRAAAAFAAGAAAPAGRDDAESRLSRLIENGYAASISPLFDEAGPAGPTRTTLRAFAAGVARGAMAAMPAGTTRSAGLVEIAVRRGTKASDLARHAASMRDVDYAFVPPERRLFAKRRPRGAPDPLASRQWGHGAIRLGHAQSARGFNDASALTVAVVDSGIDENHPDLANRIKEYKNFLRGSDKDFVGHGTHVAGIIAAGTGNGIGVSGVCGARILALKALPRDGQEFDPRAYYRALRYVIGRAEVLNLSLGGEKDPAEIDILRDVIDSGIVVVAAMGNEFEEGNPVEYPAGMAEVCAVGATDQRDRRAEFSNTGRHIDLVAPGVAILSTTPTHAYDDGERDYDSWDGTSMATPYTAGVAALVLAKFPGTRPDKVIARLKRSADRVGRSKKSSPSFGAGRLNAEAALR